MRPALKHKFAWNLATRSLAVAVFASLPALVPLVTAAADTEPGFRVLYSFQNGTDGAVPVAGLIADGSGNLFGTLTNVGGAGSCSVHCGNVYELSPANGKDGTWTFASLYNFKGGKAGGLPGGNVIFGPSGTLYGTTIAGGAPSKFGNGVVFKLVRSGGRWREMVLHTFGNGVDGRSPHGGLVADENGNLYGTTTSGGSSSACDNGCGTVYELSPPVQPGERWTETVLYTFSGGQDGFWPLAGLAIDRSGRLYGTTEYGGHFSTYCQSGCGTVFELAPPSVRGHAWIFSVLHQFDGGDGALPLGPLLLDRARNLYGTTFVSQTYGGGTAFELTPAGRHQPWMETILYRFPRYAHDAANPKAGFIFDRVGDLYATSEEGGPNEQGTVFELMPPAMAGGVWTDLVLHGFVAPKHGATYPASNLVFGLGGSLYGTTQYGGTGDCVFTKIKGCGTVFQLDAGALHGRPTPGVR